MKKMKHIKRIVLKFLLDLFIKLYAWIFGLHVCMDIVLCLLPTEVKRGHWIPLSYSYECLPTTMSCWESNQGYLQECMLLTTQSSFSHLKIFGRDRLRILYLYIHVQMPIFCYYVQFSVNDIRRVCVKRKIIAIFWFLLNWMKNNIIAC